MGRILNRISLQTDSECYIYATGKYSSINTYVYNDKLENLKVEIFDCDKSCIKRIHEQRIDTVWFFNLNHLALKLMIKPHKYRLVMTIANADLGRFKFAHLKQKIAFNFMSRKVDFLDSLYPYSEESFIYKRYTNYGISPCPFTDLERFFPQTKEKSIVFASRLEPSKNVFKAIEATKLAQDKIRKRGFILKIYGDGQVRDEMLKLIHDYELDDVVQTYHYSDMSEVLPYSSIFLSLQIITNYPSQVLLESIACGNYIVATDNVDTDRIVKDKFGCLVDNSPDNIASGICKAIELVESAESNNIVKNAREFAENNFCIDNSLDYFSKILLGGSENGNEKDM